MPGPGPGIYLQAGSAATSVAAGGLALAGALTAAFGVGIALAAVMAVVSIISTQARNKEIKKAAMETQRRLNLEHTNVQIEAADTIRRRSAVGQMVIANTSNRFQAKTGLSISERLAATGAEMTVDTEAVKFAERTRLEAIEIEKRNVIASARAGMVSPVAAGVQGAVTGFGAGVGFVSSINSLQALGQQAQNAGSLAQAYGNLDAGRLSLLATRDARFASEASIIGNVGANIETQTSNVRNVLGGLSR